MKVICECEADSMRWDVFDSCSYDGGRERETVREGNVTFVRKGREREREDTQKVREKERGTQ